MAFPIRDVSLYVEYIYLSRFFVHRWSLGHFVQILIHSLTNDNLTLHHWVCNSGFSSSHAAVLQLVGAVTVLLHFPPYHLPLIQLINIIELGSRKIAVQEVGTRLLCRASYSYIYTLIWAAGLRWKEGVRNKTSCSPPATPPFSPTTTAAALPRQFQRFISLACMAESKYCVMERSLQ